jgi:hypothetical protein
VGGIGGGARRGAEDAVGFAGGPGVGANPRDGQQGIADALRQAVGLVLLALGGVGRGDGLQAKENLAAGADGGWHRQGFLGADGTHGQETAGQKENAGRRHGAVVGAIAGGVNALPGQMPQLQRSGCQV